jgi:hypothetical protein
MFAISVELISIRLLDASSFRGVLTAIYYEPAPYIVFRAEPAELYMTNVTADASFAEVMTADFNDAESTDSGPSFAEVTASF